MEIDEKIQQSLEAITKELTTIHEEQSRTNERLHNLELNVEIQQNTNLKAGHSDERCLGLHTGTTNQDRAPRPEYARPDINHCPTEGGDCRHTLGPVEGVPLDTTEVQREFDVIKD